MRKQTKKTFTKKKRTNKNKQEQTRTNKNKQKQKQKQPKNKRNKSANYQTNEKKTIKDNQRSKQPHSNKQTRSGHRTSSASTFFVAEPLGADGSRIGSESQLVVISQSNCIRIHNSQLKSFKKITLTPRG